jgi:hypothetical protein
MYSIHTRSSGLSRGMRVFLPLDEQVISMIPTGLDIHDSIIVATAIFYRDMLRQPTTLITKDRAITQSGLIQILW